ncbi:MAG: hypothetical protein QOE31_1067 [Solirubrobacteraceae bacterium]|jgi:hypothetical protein|nr:hypothetical protein [Solirubrobacteraceae bacterium]
MERSYRIGRDGRTVVCDTIARRGEIDVLRDALAWKRDRLSRLDHDVDAVIVLRAWMTLDDMLASTSVFGDEAPLTLTSEQAMMLCELTTSYVADRDVESYQPLEERDRIALLRTLGGPLMDCCCEFVAAQAEVREPPLPV